jgi:hypothetical protein
VTSEVQQTSKSIQFYLYIGGDGVQEQILGPFTLIFSCQMSSSPNLMTGNKFEANQVMMGVSRDEVPIFIFEGFESQCNTQFPGISYQVSSKSNEVSDVEFFNEIELVGNQYQMSLNITESGKFSAFIIASQG